MDFQSTKYFPCILGVIRFFYIFFFPFNVIEMYSGQVFWLLKRFLWAEFVLFRLEEIEAQLSTVSSCFQKRSGPHSKGQ